MEKQEERPKLLRRQPLRPTGELPHFNVIEGTCLGHKAYRGFASLRELAKLSKADIFDQQRNPTGTQRNLNRQHARSAYKYVTENQKAFYPEIILNIRDSSYIKFDIVNKGESINFGELIFIKDPIKTKDIIVSRLDGNHRLYFTDGHEPSLESVDLPVSFCFLNLTNREDELEVFRDINDNQMGMNTSHLKNITARLLGEAALKQTDPSLYIVRKLQNDRTSPFYQKIHEGGKIRRKATITGLTSANLNNAIRDMLSRSSKLGNFPDADVQFELIKNFWLAVKKWLPDAWKRPVDFIIFKGVGLYAISYLGIEIIDRCLLKQKYQVDDMYAYLEKLPNKEVFTSRGGMPYAGRAGGRKIASDLIADLEEEGEISLSKLQKMILGGTS
jgi:DGQHR domain-containing protein